MTDDIESLKKRYYELSDTVDALNVEQSSYKV
jgi:hypothetical protein